MDTNDFITCSLLTCQFTFAKDSLEIEKPKSYSANRIFVYRSL